jgi:hypothetical protein
MVTGADGGTRTRTGFPPRDFKSLASTISPRPRAEAECVRGACLAFAACLPKAKSTARRVSLVADLPNKARHGLRAARDGRNASD